MNLRASAPSIAFLFLVACSSFSDSETEDSSAKASEASSNQTSTAAPNTATPVTPVSAPKPFAIEPRVKAEVDNKPDGIAAGKSLDASNAKASILAPNEWNVSKGETTVAKSADEKARVAVTSFGAEGPEPRAAAGAQAAGLTNCQWSAPETATVGKDKLSAMVADGICSRGAGQVRAARMATEGLMVIGSWDEGGDATSVFNAFRSVKKSLTMNDGIVACCNALRQNAKASPAQAPIYLMAAGACDGARKNPDSARALQSVRSMLVGANVPASCK
jgi:hypothetical protein